MDLISWARDYLDVRRRPRSRSADGIDLKTIVTNFRLNALPFDDASACAKSGTIGLHGEMLIEVVKTLRDC